MAKGIVISATLMLFCVVFHCNIVDTAAKTYVVGDEFGWDPTTDVEFWPRGKKFYAGDILVFKYDSQLYDVLKVSKEEFMSCTVSAKDPRSESGNDRIRLVLGPNYFSTSNPEDCQIGMKLAINAAKRRSPPRRLNRHQSNP